MEILTKYFNCKYSGQTYFKVFFGNFLAIFFGHRCSKVYIHPSEKTWKVDQNFVQTSTCQLMATQCIVFANNGLRNVCFVFCWIRDICAFYIKQSYSEYHKLALKVLKSWKNLIYDIIMCAFSSFRPLDQGSASQYIAGLPRLVEVCLCSRD